MKKKICFPDGDFPRFAEPVANVTVSVGRDALLACVVENLKGYKVINLINLITKKKIFECLKTKPQK